MRQCRICDFVSNTCRYRTLSIHQRLTNGRSIAILGIDRSEPLGNVEAFVITGLKCYFGSNDHYPQHFEVLKRGHWLIRVFIIASGKKNGLDWNYKKQWKGEVRSSDEALILAMVVQHKRRLLREWDQKVVAAQNRKEQ